ncbi:MAG: hypothetical protein WBB51_02620 [Candidatus Microthrix parvicella]|jgi:hypothetical protein
MKDSPAHLYRRFRYHVGPEPDPAAADRWAAARLDGEEWALFASMTVRDRVHSVAVARRVEQVLAGGDQPGGDGHTAGEGHAAGGGARKDTTDGWQVRAGLLHDAGKALAPLGTTGRVVASLAEGTVAGDWLERRATDRTGAPQRRGPMVAMGAYLTYTELGAQRLEAIGSHPMVAAWAREHHWSPERWTVPQSAGAVLAECDEEL